MRKRNHKMANKPRSREVLAFRSPVAYLYAKDDIASKISSLKVQIWIRHEGEEAVECLAQLAWIIGIATETERVVHGLTHELRSLHGCLRMIQAWCLTGYTWQIADPAGIDRCLDIAHPILIQHSHVAIGLIDGAELLTKQIRTKTVDQHSVAGAEIYQLAA